MSAAEEGTGTVRSQEFYEPFHAEKILAGLNELRADGNFIDVLLLVSGQTLPCHRAVVASCSAYFRAMFYTGMKESRQEVIQVDGISADALALLLDYAYTARLVITQENVQPLLEAANFLLFHEVKEACVSFLAKELDPCNCLGIHRLARIQDLDRLADGAQTFALKHFTEVSVQEEFYELCKDDLIQLISNDDLQVEEETSVLRAVLRWAEHDSVSREEELGEILRHVRLETIPPSELQGVVEMEPSLNRGDIRDVLRDVVAEYSGTDETKLRSRKTEMMLVVGGNTGEPHPDVYLFDPCENTWTACARWPGYERHSYVTTPVGRDVYVTGGSNRARTEELTTVWVYSVERDVWREAPAMPTARCAHGAAELGGYLYVVGGWQGGLTLNDVERYDPKTEKWEVLTPMVQSVRRCGVAAFRYKLYVICGYDGNIVYANVQCFDPVTESWTTVSICPRPRFRIATAVIGDSIYVVGGATTICDRYDPDTNEWTPAARMTHGRKHVGVTVVMDKLYVTGGAYAGSAYASVDCYDPATNRWEVAAMLPRAMYSHGCVRVKVKKKIKGIKTD
uniref:BTB domain-containing protein n=1 Tax=Branchiostoma floridae TaxID=7739 RepID=C3Y0G2_BRAFL|eukprot:XP_002610225.1 hypothetical protein BRAFLDRAFT_245796 [Branchiostoma floridae]